ncbi:MAG TPA: CotH kinase family protein [Verrucomicrobiota bacterium]|nr:CotH kinase family protein [Verrucomicrobiota bacterium]HNU51163.1 CotH kinase family protein [Verrucomicrobiota bacterium]
MLAALLEPALAAQPVRINELQPANDSSLLDEDGAASDWIELWNPAPAPADLSGWGLSDDGTRPFQWVFGPGSVLPPDSHLVVFASGKNRQPQLAEALDPGSIPGLVVWLRADRINPDSIVQVRRSGNEVFVRQWQDQSGGGNHASQETATLQPLWLAVGPGGLPALRFDGLNDLLRLPRPPGTNDFCLFAVCRTSQSHEVDDESPAGVGGTRGQRWLLGAAHGGDLDAGAGVSVGTNGASVYEHGSGYMPALSVSRQAPGAGLLVLAVNYAARQPTLDLQGLVARAGLLSPRRDVRAPTEIGSGAYGAFGGDLLELLAYDRPLTETERRGVARGLAIRHGVALPLPRHTNFRLSAGGEEVVLTRPDGTLADRVSFGAVPRDVSYGASLVEPGTWYYYPAPTPGAANATPGGVEWLAPPRLSHEGGFYPASFELALDPDTPGAEIRCTLDGSDPTPESPLYTRPIPIRSRTGTPNDLSAIPTVPGGQPPLGEVFKGWTVRARAFKPRALPSGIVSRTYWVHPQGRRRYSLPVVALATDRKNFFDPDIGIYVPGNAPGGNYSQRGNAWQRPVHVEFYEADNRLAFAQDADVKIHGNTSQNFPIKGLDLDGTGGAGRRPFRYPIFPDRTRTEFEHVLLRPSGHDHGMAFMRDELMQSLASETGAESQAARPCIVFLNGEYWGLHHLKEKQDAEFVGFYGDIPVDALDYLEGYAAAKSGDTRHYDAMLQYLAANDPAIPLHYDCAGTLMDVPNYIDYKVCEIFNYRWDIGNHRLWRPRTPEGRWRWLQFDNDVGWGGFWAEQPGWAYDMLSADLSPDGRLHEHNNETTTFLLRRLMRNDSFRRDFIHRFADLLNSTFAPAHTRVRIREFARQLEPEIAEHTRRWRAPASLDDWQAAVAYLDTFAQLRPDFCRQHLLACFQLPGTVAVTIEVLTTGADAVRLNTLRVLDADGNGWKGMYFRGLPLTLRAEPAPGHRFVRWTGPVESAGPETRIVPLADVTVSAVFAATPARALLVERVLPAPDGSAEIVARSEPGQTVGLQSSADLRSWAEETWTMTDTEGVGSFRAAAPLRPGPRFFRLRLP